jgi:hypothetical protein
MAVYEVDPLSDPRWPEFLQRDDRASIFHTPSWLSALSQTYRYEPVVLTTSPPNEDLTNGLVFCRVNSWLTGRRMVSLPFSDHCEPLVSSRDEVAEIVAFMEGEIKKRRLKYIEIRPLCGPAPGAFSESDSFCFHTLSLGPSEEEILNSLHKDSIKRKIQRAKRECLTYEKGNTEFLLDKFYRLFVMTRRRHGLPPSPRRWFANLLKCLGGSVQIRIASKNETPIAATLTLTYKNSIVYKYGSSDSRFNSCGGMPFLFWMMILEAKGEGLDTLDLGRSDLDNDGLITFKDRWGSTRSTLTYWRLPLRSAQHSKGSTGWTSRLAKQVFAYAPDALRIEVGNFMYKHLG